MPEIMPVLDVLAHRQIDANGAAARRRDHDKRHDTAKPLNMVSYREGEAAAYLDAHRLVTNEMKRLCNLFQNGSLTIADFGVVL